MRILDEASQLRAYSRELEEKSLSLQRATAELRAANEQLKSLDKLKDDFMSSVTHELRTPLTSIRALAELMVDETAMSDDQRHQFLRIIVGETERLTRLVNQVLDMAKIESGSVEWRNSEVDMRALLTQAAQTTSEMFRERGASLTLTMPEHVPMLLADSDRLMQVLLNLLSNAAKFVPAEGGRVEMRLTSDTRGVRVEVQDNGPGVPDEQQALIFEKFHQGGDAIRRPQGTARLPISRQIVDILADACGCVLYRATAHASPSSCRGARGPRFNCVGSHRMSCKILIADDEPTSDLARILDEARGLHRERRPQWCRGARHAAARASDARVARRDDAGEDRFRGVSGNPCRRRTEGHAHPDAHGKGSRHRRGQRACARRRRLRHQAVFDQGTGTEGA
jgi:hypothetical protein